ncbi:hypothetical protein L9F63_004923, partial [Diploptera punctata]
MDLLSPKMIKLFGIEPERGIKEFLNYNISRLRYLGIWRWNVPHFMLNRAFACLQIISLAFFAISSAISGYYNRSDLDHLTKITISVVFITLLIFKNIYLIVRMDKVYRLINQLENEFFTPVRQPTTEQLAIVNKYGARAKFFTIMRSNLALGIITFWLLAPIKDVLTAYATDIIEDETHNNISAEFILPFEGYYPYDVKYNILNYVLTYMWHVFCGLTVFIGMPAWDMLFVSIFIHTSGHFRALQHVLFNLERDSQKVKSFSTTNSQPLKKCSMFVKHLEEVLSPVMLMQLMASVIAFCVIGFQMSVVSIKTHSERVLNAAYHCEWYATDMRFRKNLRLLMERAKRPIKLTAGGFSHLTLEGFASVSTGT